MADRALKEFVEPVPEAMVLGKTAKEQHEVSQGHRAFTRLKAQEEALALQTQLKSAKATERVMKPQRRVPLRDPHATVKVNIPTILQRRGTDRVPLGQSSGLKPNKEVLQMIRATAGERTMGQTAGTTFAKTDRVATVQLKEGQVVKNPSPTERIGLLYTPTANVRTTGRNDQMRSIEYSTRVAAVGPPPAAKPELTEGDLAVAGKDPLMSHFLPLEEFDNAEFESRTPEEWVALGANGNGTPARSRYADPNGDFKWTPCTAQHYDPDSRLFTVTWNHNGKEKQVRRLNLIFDEEDDTVWQARYDDAFEARAMAEAQVRLHLYVDGLDEQLVAPVDEDQVDRVLSLVAKEFPLQHLHVIERGIQELRDTHNLGLKRAVHNYTFRSAEERERVQMLALPAVVDPPPPSLDLLLGTIDTPSPNYGLSRGYLEENLFQTHALLDNTIRSIHARWLQYEDMMLCDTRMAGVQLPCELHVFVEAQNKVVNFVSDRLKEDWSVNVVTTIQNELDQHFNFFEENMERFNGSRMSRFCKMINLVMGAQLRLLLVASIEAYSEFLQRYRVVLPADLDVEEDTVHELEEDRSEREYWEKKADAVLQRRRLEREARDAESGKKKKKGGGMSPGQADSGADDGDDNGEGGGKEEEVEEEQEAPALEFGFFENPNPFSRRVLDMTREPNGLDPLFVLKLMSNGDSVVYSPLLEEVEDKVKNVFGNFFTCTDDVRGLGDQLFPMLQLPVHRLRPLAGTDAVVLDNKEIIHRALLENMQGPRQLQQLYQAFEYILKVEVDALVESFRTRQPAPTQEDFDNALERLYRDVERIQSRTLNDVKFELITVECDGIKRELTAKAHEIATALMDLLAAQLNESTERIMDEYSDIHRKIGIEPKTPEELQELKDFIDGVPAEMERLAVDFARVTGGSDLLLRYRYVTQPDDFERYWTAYEWPRKVTQVLEDSEFKYREYRNAFQLELRDNCQQLTDDITSLASNVESLARFSDETRAEDYYDQVKILAGKIQKYQDAITLYNSHEALFGMPATQWSHIKDIRQQFEPYQTLWEIAFKYNASYERWMSRPLKENPADEAEQDVNDWSRKLAQVAKKLKDEAPAGVCARLREGIDKFKPNLPLMKALRGNLQPHHMKQIAKLVNQSLEMENPTLNDYLKAGLLDHIAQIEEIADMAEKTHGLQKQLDNMNEAWKKVTLTVEPHKDTESYKLKASEEVQQQLDDHIQKTQLILGSPYVRMLVKLEDTAKKWEQQLLRVQQVLDEWFKCQATWSYLSPIFSSNDIAQALPNELVRFQNIDTSWRQIMQVTLTNLSVLVRCQDEKLLATFKDHNESLDIILKEVHRFLEKKRRAFPRFYFVSNDELLRILSDSKDPYRVQPYLGKCFEGIKTIHFQDSLDITAMESAEGEIVQFGMENKVNPADHGNAVEQWLSKVEESMCKSIREHIRLAIEDYKTRKRTEFVRYWPGQVVLAVTQLSWTMEATDAMVTNGYNGLETYHGQCKAQLEDLVLLVRDNTLKAVERCTLEALVVLEVHAKDVIQELAAKKIDSPASFDWLSQLRYYWEEGDLNVKQTNAMLPYGYEYLGNTGRLVITQLTDRCYRTLMGALHLNYGGAPEGPAGTGKTETTKDLAKALAKQCVVYNCSDQITYLDMAKLFKGLAQAGAWGCFDEFNRIEVQVLSVIAQQVATIQEAIAQNRVGQEFMFDGVSIRLKQGSAVFITMNPGYAGRAELPDNLKALFRPVAMMVPNYAMIGEIQLYSYGFLEGKTLAEKIVATYSLCSEQLSSQDHYDYGMRAVKAVLTAAGRLKRKYPDSNEHVLMLRSIQDVNLPKFLAQDVELFRGIVSDLFPGVELPEPDYDAMDVALADCCRDTKLQLTPYFKLKCFETYEMIVVRHGMMLVGMSYGGKTKVLTTLARALGVMNKKALEERTRITTLNPKAVTLGQLYGMMDVSGEWSDGVLANAFRICATDTAPDRKWLIMDGPVDAVWIENMNTVLDDNKKLCLTNGDIIPMPKQMNMIFEVQDLAHASPATVSRCGMVYVEPDTLGWQCLFDSYILVLPAPLRENEAVLKVFTNLVAWLIDPMLHFVRRHCSTAIPQGNSVAVASFIKLFNTFLDEFRTSDAANKDWDERETMIKVEGHFLFALTWSIGGTLDVKQRLTFNQHLMETLQGGCSHDRSYKISVPLPDRRSFYDCMFQFAKGEGQFVDWLDTMDDFKIPDNAQYHEIIVPTADTARYTFLIRNFVLHNLPCLLVGDTGTGKTIMTKSLLSGLDKETYLLNLIQFSAQTSANQTQELIEAKADVRRRRGTYGPPVNKKLIVFVDDLNMPQQEEYGAQPPIEIMRQWMDHNGWYNHKREDVGFRRTEDLLFIGAMGPPGGGRNHVTPRFTRHFNTVSVPSFDDGTLKKIFCCLMDWIVSRGYPPGMRSVSHSVVGATIDVYQTLVEKLKPTPEKSHYTFNLRDVSKVFQGIAMAAPQRIHDTTKMYRLWGHEVARAFADRFIDQKDTDWFVSDVLNTVMQTHFKVGYSSVMGTGEDVVLFSDFTNDSRLYEEVDDMTEARQALEAQVESYNETVRGGQLDLVIFNYVIDHVARIGRVLRQPFGHMLLVGVGGSGRTSCTKLACKIQEYDFMTVTVTKGFGRTEFLEAVKKLLERCGRDGIPTAFFVNDTHIVKESFLEDISNLLNTGEVPGLFPPDELDAVSASLRNVAKEMGRELSRESLHSLFLERCRIYLHCVLAFSPVGNTLRDRLRKFPSLVNCTTIDWFREWPQEGLRNVAMRFLSEIELEDDMRTAVCECFVQFQDDVRQLGVTYLAEARQHTYVTPTSYIELLNTFRTLLESKRRDLLAQRHRYDHGLEQLSRTEEEVDRMQKELEILKPQLKRTAKQTDELILVISKESEDAEKIRAVVSVEEEAANIKADKSRKIKDECEAKVAEAQPKLDEAKAAAEQLNMNELREVRALGNPPEKVKTVIEAVCCLLGGSYKPAPRRSKETGKLEMPYWEHAQKTLMNDFKNILLGFDATQATEQQITEAQKYIKMPMFNPNTIGQTSKALVGVVRFVIASEQYYQLDKLVRPLKADQAAAEAEFNAAMSELKIKMDELAVVDAELSEKKEGLEKVKREKQELEDKVADTDTKLKRAVQLISGLGGEKARYVTESERLAGEYSVVLGDVVMSSATVAYLGPFQNKFRHEVLPKWMEMCKRLRIPGTEPFVFERFLGNPLHTQDWKMQGLPSDTFSVDNAIIMTNARRWPLLVDPQQQANKWIRNLEKADLVVVRPTEKDYSRVISAGVRDGKAVLLENIEEDLDPVLENLLLKRVVREGNSYTIKIGEPVEYNNKFRFYITTKLPRPHYRPEVSTKVALVNFMITQDGLQDQLLGRVVAFEKPEADEKMQRMTIEMASVRTSLKETEDQILALLGSEGNLLENESAIQQLDRAKAQSDKAAQRQQEIAAAEKTIDKTRNQYRSAATLGANLFFCVSELTNIDPMYQYSLQFYINLFLQALVDAPKAEEVQERVDNIQNTFQRSLYTRVCRGLFAKDQLLFSFIMCLKMFPPDPAEVRWLLLGGMERDTGLGANPFHDWLPDLNWKLIWRATTQLPAFSGLERQIKDNLAACKEMYQAADPLTVTLTGDLGALQGLHKLVLMRCLRADKLVTAVHEYVCRTLDKFYTEPPLTNLEEVSDELHHDTSVPIIFVLSPGADPNAELDRVAEIKGMGGKRLTKLSLGQGQDKPAERLIAEGTKQGNWVLLQNCHLFKDFMPQLARIIEDYSRDEQREKLHRDYRLWLTSMPSDTFPVSVLQNGAKLVQEPPKGLKNNLYRSYMSDPIADPKFFVGGAKPEVFKKLLFGICFFHSLVQERRKFGPLGFNIPYEFNDTDMRISVRQLKMFVSDNSEVPYEAITYLAGQCNYGGRVTDDWDRRCLMAILNMFYTPDILEDGYHFSPTGDYYAPEGDHEAYLAYIRDLPVQQTPDVFGLHLNADITKDEREMRLLMESALATQPRESSSGDSATLDPKTVVFNMARDVHARMPPPYDTEEVTKKYPLQYDQSMNTVLMQELIRYNRLVVIVRKSMSELQKAIKGEVVMSADLEQVFNAMYDGRVPQGWRKRSYPSLKPFGAYINDLLERLGFLQRWIDDGPPPVFWLSGFFFTQSFLTGVKQNYARRQRIEIDKLRWDFVVQSAESFAEAPEHGCYINGLFLEGAGWDPKMKWLCESRPKELFVTFPIVYLVPVRPDDVSDDPHYQCPAYKTTDRRGVLSTTGHSTNFIMVFKLPRNPDNEEAHWIKRGTALFTQLEY